MAAGLLLVLGACRGDDPSGGASDGGSSSDGGSPQEIISAAASATEEAGTARIASEQVTSAQGQELTTILEGTVDLASGD